MCVIQTIYGFSQRRHTHTCGPGPDQLLLIPAVFIWDVGAASPCACMCKWDKSSPYQGLTNHCTRAHVIVTYDKLTHYTLNLVNYTLVI